MLTFREVEMKDAAMILDWRTKPRVSEKMLSIVSGELEPHLSWMRAAYESDTYYHWIIQSNGRDVGLVSVNGIDRKAKKTSWGYYIGSDEALGIGGTVPAYVYNFLFSSLWDIEVITAEVLETNPDVIRMHQMYGYIPTPELDYKLASGKRVVTMNLSKSDWKNSNKFKNFVATFPLSKSNGQKSNIN